MFWSLSASGSSPLLAFQRFMTGSWTILGSCSLCGEIEEALELLRKGAISVDEIVSHQVSLEEMPEYLSRVGSPDTLKVQLVLDTPDSR